MSENTQSSKSMNPVLKGILIFLGGLLILLVIAQLFVSFFADDYAADTLRETIQSSSDSTYAIDFDDLDLDILSGSATITNLRINADTTAFSDSSSSKKPPKMLFLGNIGEVKVSGVNILSGALGDELRISSITLEEPNIFALRNHRPVSSDSNGNFNSVDSSLYAAIPKRYSALEIGELKINNGYGALTESGDTLTSLGRLNISLRDIRVDSASAQSGRAFITDHFSVNAKDFMTKLPDSLNTIKLGNLVISSDDQAITLDSLELIPRYPRFGFGRENRYEIDRIDLTIPEISVRQIDVDRFIDSARFYAKSIEINNARLVDFRNKNLPFPPDNNPPLPHTALRNLSQKIKIDTLRVNNAYIEYNEYWYEAPRAGTVTFEELNATMYGITNYSEDINQGKTIVMDARTRVMGTGLLEAHFEFPMNTENGFHKVNGRLSSMSLTDFNPILQYVAFARIDEGTLNSLEFDMTLNDNSSNGTLIMNYENFKISLLDKKTIEQQGIVKHLGTFLANNFIIKENNTPEDGMRAGPIEFERIQRKAVFNYWWKSLLSGIKESVR